MQWKNLGRKVKKGEKAIGLIMPINIKKKIADEKEGETTVNMTIYQLKNNWFTLDQTEGPEFATPAKAPVTWSKEQALSNLQITEVPFDQLNGNIQGYAKDRSVAVSPIAALPFKTLFHELAHVVLGHTEASATMADEAVLPKALVEAEAEASAYLCCAALSLPGMEECRGYIQHWLKSDTFPEKSAKRVINAANKILKAGVSEKDELPA